MFNRSITGSKEHERWIAEEMPSPHVPRNSARLMFTHAEGPYIYDLDGNQYIDLDNGKGSIILGHNDPDVRSALIERLEEKQPVATGRHGLMLQLAARISQDVGDDIAVSFFRTGTTAVRAAAQLARILTGKSIILSAGYHGWDQMWQLSPSLFEPNAEMVINFFFVPEYLEKLLSHYAGKVAAVVISPDHVYFDEDYYQDIFALCRRWPEVLIIDDQVKQGYRYGPGSSLICHYGLRATLTVFSKAITNGSDLSCVCGQRELMWPARNFIYTSYFDILPITAALATLEKLERTNAQQHIRETGNLFIARLNELLGHTRLPIEITGDGNLFRLVFGQEELESAFYSEAGINGIVFYEGDNQCPSAAFTAEVYNDLLERLSRTLALLSSKFDNLKGTPITTEARWLAAWKQADGFPHIENVSAEDRLRFIKQRVIEELAG